MKKSLAKLHRGFCLLDYQISGLTMALSDLSPLFYIRRIVTNDTELRDCFHDLSIMNFLIAFFVS